MPRRLVAGGAAKFEQPIAMRSRKPSYSIPLVPVAALAVMVLLLASAAPVFAQLPSGTILGVVKDNSGNVIVGARVTVSNDTGLSRTFTTDAGGSYRFPELPVGTYRLEVNQPGFKTATER